MDWKMILGIGFWWVFDLSIIALAIHLIRKHIWKPLLDFLDLNKESIR